MRYRLRYVAGIYWLVDTGQEGMPYRTPLTMNEVGADIWKMMERGFHQDKITDLLCQEYQVSKETALSDVEQFQKQLVDYGIKI